MKSITRNAAAPLEPEEPSEDPMFYIPDHGDRLPASITYTAWSDEQRRIDQLAIRTTDVLKKIHEIQLRLFLVWDALKASFKQ